MKIFKHENLKLFAIQTLREREGERGRLGVREGAGVDEGRQRESTLERCLEREITRAGREREGDWQCETMKAEGGRERVTLGDRERGGREDRRRGEGREGGREKERRGFGAGAKVDAEADGRRARDWQRGTGDKTLGDQGEGRAGERRGMRGGREEERGRESLEQELERDDKGSHSGRRDEEERGRVRSGREEERRARLPEMKRLSYTCLTAQGNVSSGRGVCGQNFPASRHMTGGACKISSLSHSTTAIYSRFDRMTMSVVRTFD